MAGTFEAAARLLRRWSRQEENALRQMAGGKTAGQRIAGFSRSERLDAKFLLLALVPFVPVMVSDALGWSRGLLWHTWFWLSVGWAVFIVTICLVAYWRALRKSSRRKR